MLRAVSFLGTVSFLAACAATPEVQTPDARPAPSPAAVPSADPVATTPEPAPVEPTPAPAQEVVPTDSPEGVAKRLAEVWRRDGGTFFSKSGVPLGEDELPPAEDFTIEVVDERETGDLQTAVLVLRPKIPFGEEKQYLYIKRGGKVGTVELAHGFSSGVGGFSHYVVVRSDAREREGDSPVRWWAEVEVEQHDSDMGLCAENGSMQRDLVFCSAEPSKMRCLQVPIERSEYKEQGTRDKAGSCSARKVTNRGYALDGKVDGSKIVLSPRPRTELRRPFSQSLAPPFKGSQPIAGLWNKAEVPIRWIAP
ncbi:MAG: hypothetical protein HOW73_11325 [Polyangiaceae bacterium]|nr:hypothetical protein [Polyangiaceae bacterium]